MFWQKEEALVGVGGMGPSGQPPHLDLSKILSELFGGGGLTEIGLLVISFLVRNEYEGCSFGRQPEGIWVLVASRYLVGSYE